MNNYKSGNPPKHPFAYRSIAADFNNDGRDDIFAGLTTAVMLVPQAMAYAFENTSGHISERMMASLEAAEDEGGDIRGKQSASMLVVSGEPTGIPWEDTVMDIRVDDHTEPLIELRRLIRIHKAYQHANMGDKFMEDKKIDEAMLQYEKATSLYPKNPELPYWSAVTLASTGNIDAALPIFSDVFSKSPKLKDLTPRLVISGLLPDDQELIERIKKNFYVTTVASQLV